MAYAAVISLRHSIERLINPTIDPQITKSAAEELEFLEHVLQRLDRSSTKRSVFEDLDTKIREAVWKLEDVIQSYALSLSLPSSNSLDHEGVKEEIDSFMKMAKKLGEEYNRELDKNEDADGHVSTIADFAGKKSTVVGLSDQCEEIKDKLLDPEPRCKIVSIVGMAGIDKTVLAREVHRDLIHSFDLTAWVSLGPMLQTFL